MMIIQTISKKKKISEFLAVVGMIFLILDTINTFTSQHGYGFLLLCWMIILNRFLLAFYY